MHRFIPIVIRLGVTFLPVAVGKWACKAWVVPLKIYIIILMVSGPSCSDDPFDPTVWSWSLAGSWLINLPPPITYASFRNSQPYSSGLLTIGFSALRQLCILTMHFWKIIMHFGHPWLCLDWNSLFSKKSSICYSGGETFISFLPFFLNVPSYARIFDVSGGVVSTDLSEDIDTVQIRKQTNWSLARSEDGSLSSRGCKTIFFTTHGSSLLSPRVDKIADIRAGIPTYKGNIPNPVVFMFTCFNAASVSSRVKMRAAVALSTACT